MAAERGLTNGVWVELEPQGTLGSALVPGLTGTQTLFDYASVKASASSLLLALS